MIFNTCFASADTDKCLRLTFWIDAYFLTDSFSRAQAMLLTSFWFALHLYQYKFNILANYKPSQQQQNLQTPLKKQRKLSRKLWICRSKFVYYNLIKRQMQEIEDDERREKKSITQLLVDNSVYDCMPINSYIVSIDKDLSMHEAIRLLVAEGYDELLIWQCMTVRWTLIFSLADAIRFTLFAVRSLVENQSLSFSNSSFQRLAEDYIQRYGKQIPEESSEGDDFSEQMQLEKEDIPFQNITISQFVRQRFIEEAHNLTVYNFMLEVYDLQNFQLKTVSMDTKLTAVILKMLAQKIHRIIVEQKGSKMYTSILCYKDILLFLLRTLNEELTNTNQYSLPISVLIENRKSRENTVDITENVWTAFNNMINKNKTAYLNVVDLEDKYITTIFRQDFYLILKNWKLDLLALTLKDFITLRNKQYEGSAIPQFGMFHLNETIRQIVEKILLCRRNTLVCVDENGHVEYTIGLSELFNLYIL